MEFDFLKEAVVMETYHKKLQEFTKAIEELSDKISKDMGKGIFPAEKIKDMSAVLDQMTKIIKDISKE